MGFLSDLWDSAKSAVSFVTEKVSDAYSWVKEEVTSAVNTVSTTISDIYDSIKSSISSDVQEATASVEEIKEAIPEIVAKPWYEKLLEFILTPLFAYTSLDRPLFQASYKLLTGKEMTDAEYELKKLELADWVLPIELISKLFFGKNLKGESVEFGSSSDWIETAILLAAFIIPGSVDDVAAKFTLKTISKSQADDLVKQLGKTGVVDDLIKRIKLHPETSAKFLSKFPVGVRNAVINGLGRTAFGREAIYILGKTGYFKYTAPGLKGFLAKAGLGPTWFKLIVGTLAGYLTFANFLAWSGKEALVETLSFPIWALIDTEDYQGVLDHVEALKESIKAAEIAMVLTKPIPLVANIWKGYIINANKQADIYEKIARDGLAKIGETGILVIRPTPEDAKVSVEGQIPTTGTFSKELQIGIYSWTISKFGYASKSGSINVLKDMSVGITGEDATIYEEIPEIALVPEILPEEVIGKLTINVAPADAVIEIAGLPEIITIGTYDLTPGSYSVKASKEGFISQTKIAYVSDKKDTVVSFILEEIEKSEEIPAKAVIQITSQPTNSDIYIDGKYTFTKTPFTTMLDAGTYIIRVQQDGFFPQEASVTIGKGDEMIIPFILEEIPEPEKPVVEYLSQTQYFPTYQAPTYYKPAVSLTPYSQVSIPSYNLLDMPSFKLQPKPTIPVSEEKEILINIETTGVKPWNSKIFSIAWLDLSMPEAEPQIIVDEDEQGVLKAFIDMFEAEGFIKIWGFKTIFDYRFIFNKLMLYRMKSKAFYDADLGDVKQLLDQVKEAFVYFPDKTGKLDDYGKELLGVGKYGSQADLLRRYIAGDIPYVERFQLQQINVTKGLYDLFYYSASGSSSKSNLSTLQEGSNPSNYVPKPVIQTNQTKPCPECLSARPLTESICDICGHQF